MEDIKYRVYTRRWLVWLAYIGINAALCYFWATFFSVTTEAWHYYGFTDAASGEAAMSALSMVIMAGMVILSIPVSAIFAKFGWFKPTAAAGVLLAVCAVVRGYCGTSYTWLMITTIGASLTQPFTLNCFGMLAAKWFPPKERGIANAGGLVSVYIGTMIAQFGFPWMQSIGLDFAAILKIFGYLTVILAVLFIVIGKEEPSVPPCEPELVERINYVDGIKNLVTNKKFIIATLIYFALNGVYGSFTTLIDPIVQYFNNSSIDSMFVGTLGTIITITGCIGTLLLPSLTDRDAQHRRLPMIRICLAGSVVGLILFMTGHSSGMLILASAVFGFLFMGVQAVSVIFGCESGYPVSEGTTNSILQLIGNLGSLIILAVINAAFMGNHLYSMIFIIGMTILSMLLACFSKEASLHDRKLEK